METCQMPNHALQATSTGKPDITTARLENYDYLPTYSQMERQSSKVKFVEEESEEFKEDFSGKDFVMERVDSQLSLHSQNSQGGGSSRRSIEERLNRDEEITRPEGRFGEGLLGDFRFACGKFINHPNAENFITFVIFCNTIFLVLGTFDFAKENKKVADAFAILDQIFLIIFTFESALQLIYRDIKLFKNRWLTFDFLLVALSWAFQTFTVLRAIRILKIASKIASLQKLITALMDVIPNITAIFSLLMLVFYIFAVMFTTLFKDLDLSADYFSRLDKTLFSLFQFMTMDWQEAAREVQQYVPWAPLLFVLFEIVSGFIVFNLIVAVLCEALGLLEKESEDEGKSASDRERIESMVSLMQRVDDLKMRQMEIKKILGDLSSTPMPQMHDENVAE
jgi:hypothetical protein